MVFPRRLSLVLVVTFISIVLFSTFHYSQSSFPGSTGGGQKYKGDIKVHITESGGSHDEVFAALLNSFGSHPQAELALYPNWPRYSIVDIWDGFKLPRPIPKFKHSNAYVKETLVPDVLVFTTCELDSLKYMARMEEFLADPQQRTKIICTIHHGDRWASTKLVDLVKPWIEADRIIFVTLSRHVKDFFLFNAATRWQTKTKPRVEVLVPVYPVNLPAVESSETSDLSFALQGDFDPTRRNYKEIFQQLEGLKSERPVQMHLVGHGKKPEVPAAVKDHVIFDVSLTYPKFYEVLSRQFALLPAFASPEYLDRKASSSMPASLMAGVPVLANRPILQAYDYLSEEDVWLEEELGMSLKAVSKMVAMTEQEREQKRQNVRRKAENIWKGNQVMAQKMIDDWVNSRAHVEVKKDKA